MIRVKEYQVNEGCILDETCKISAAAPYLTVKYRGTVFPEASLDFLQEIASLEG
jgi:hypothetical protein